MSQSSQSSRKRKASSSSSQSSSIWSGQKKRKFKLSLSKSIKMPPVTECPEVVINYTALAAKFQIKESCAKKHVTTLIKQPQVHILQVDESKLVFEEPMISELTNNVSSPILGSKKKLRRKLHVVKQEPVDIDEQVNTSCVYSQNKEAEERLQFFFNSMEIQDENSSLNFQQSHSAPGHQVQEVHIGTSNVAIDESSEINSLYPNINNIDDIKDGSNQNDHNFNLIPFGRIEIDHVKKDQTNTSENCDGENSFNSEISLSTKASAFTNNERQTNTNNAPKIKKITFSSENSIPQKKDVNIEKPLDPKNNELVISNGLELRIRPQSITDTDDSTKDTCITTGDVVNSTISQNDFIDNLSPNEILETLNSNTEDIPKNCGNSKSLSSQSEANDSCDSEYSLKIDESKISEDKSQNSSSNSDLKSEDKSNKVCTDQFETKVVDNHVDESFENICNDLEQLAEEQETLQQPDIVQLSEKQEPPRQSDTVQLTEEQETSQQPDAVQLSEQKISERSSSPVLGRNRLIKKKTPSSPILGRKTSASQSRSIRRKSRNSQASETRSNSQSQKTSSPVKSSNKVKLSNKIDETWDSFIVPDTISLMEDNDEVPLDQIVDPRIRKRKQKEEKEKMMKLCDELKSSQASDTLNDASPVKKMRLTAFDRLRVSPSPTKKTEIEKNTIKNIVKEFKHRQSDIEESNENELLIDLHPHELFSDDDSEDEERHNKFTSERTNAQNNEPRLQNNYALQNRLRENQKSQFDAIPNPMSDRLEQNSQASTIKKSVLNSNSLNNIRTPLMNRLGPHPSTSTSTLMNRLGTHTNTGTSTLMNRLGTHTNTSASTLMNRLGTHTSTSTSTLMNRLGISTIQACRSGQSVNNSTITNKKMILLDDTAPETTRSFGVPNVKKPPITSRIGVKTKLSTSVKSPTEPEIELEILSDAQKSKAQNVVDKHCMTYSETGDTEQFNNSSMLDGGTKPLNISSSSGNTNFFRNYCFKALTLGDCSYDNCKFSHQISFLQRLIKQKKGKLLYNILDCAIQSNYSYFLQKVWSSILDNLKEESFKYFEEFYKNKIYTENVLHELLKFCLESKLYSVESFVKKIASIIQVGDNKLVKDLCVEIKPKLRDGFCYETVKDLCERASPPTDIIEISLLEVLKRKKSPSHMNELYNLIKNRLTEKERSSIDQELLKKFYDLVQRNDDAYPADREIRTTVPLNGNHNGFTAIRSVSSTLIENKQPIGSVRPPINKNPLNATNQPICRSKKMIDVRIPVHTIPLSNDQNDYDSPLQAVFHAPKNGEMQNFKEYVPPVIEDLPDPPNFGNIHTKKIFWKLSVAVEAIVQGLENQDYEYVWRTMDQFTHENENEQEQLKHAYFHILCKNVKKSERHLSEIISRAVNIRSSTSRKSIEILFEICLIALIELAEHELWIMALQLLESVQKIVKPDENRTTFILISAEIYLANNNPVEALYLLQSTRVIRTNRDEWRVTDSTQDHERHRNKVVFLLLKALRFVDAEKAVYLFNSLIEDQYIAYFPIDLTSVMDRLVLTLLWQEKYDLVVEACRLVMNKNLTFKKDTYHEIIKRTFSFDDVFANQVLDYATHLGYYADIQINQGFTTLIMDTKLSEEEVYMIMKRLISKLMSNIGVAVDHLTPNQLKVTLIFEDIPEETRLRKDEISNWSQDRYKDIRQMVNTVLATRFNPPIRISSMQSKDKFCKLMSRTIVKHLQQWST